MCSNLLGNIKETKVEAVIVEETLIRKDHTRYRDVNKHEIQFQEKMATKVEEEEGDKHRLVSLKTSKRTKHSGIWFDAKT